MSGRDVFGTPENSKVVVGIMENHSVESLIKGFLERAREIDSDFELDLSALVLEVKKISPINVERGGVLEIKSLTDPSFGGKDDSILQDFYNTLNLCVVGLGSKIKEKNG